MPSGLARVGNRSRTSKAACAHAPTDGRYVGTRPAGPAPPRPRTSAARRRAGRRGWPPPSPRAAAGRDHPVRPSARPSRAASAYPGSPRWTACPPITPTRCRPAVQSSRAPSMRVVVQARAERLVAAAGALRPGEGPGVERVGVGRGVVELAGGVEGAAGRVERATPGSSAAPGRRQPGPARRRRGRSGSPRRWRRSAGTSAVRRALGEVDTVDPPPPHRLAPAPPDGRGRRAG